MSSDPLQPRQPATLASPQFLFDSGLNLMGEASGETWPVAVLAGLQSCVRGAIAAGNSSFVPFGIGPRWCIVPVQCRGAARFAVGIEGSR